MKQESIDREDFMLRIRPTVNSDGSWNGEIDVAIIRGDIITAAKRKAMKKPKRRA